MRILLTNDDGISSVGLKLLEDFVRSLGFSDIWIVAPKNDRSATSHSVTLNKPILLEKISDKVFTLDGTPTDCVIVAMRKLFQDDKKPGLLFSGVNVGANVGIDKIYSGTVAAAMEGLFFGIPSISISQLYNFSKENLVWNVDSMHLSDCVKKILKHKEILENCVASINLPHVHVKGVKYTKQGSHKMSNIISHSNKLDGFSDDHGDHLIIHAANKPIHCQELASGYITVTPIGCDMTNYNALKFLNENLT